MDDRRHAVAAIACRPALPALPGIGERLLEGGLGDADALHADRQPGVVHHGEHAGQAAVFLADQPADRALRFDEAVAIDHRAGRRGVDAELVLEAGAEDIVAGADPAVVIDQEFRHQEERDAAGSRWRVGQPRQHHVDDVVGQVVLAIGDEDLLARDAVGAVAGRLGAGPDGVEVGAGLRLGQVHRAHPFAGDELAQVFLLQRLGSVLFQRLDRAHGERRPDGKGHRAGVPHVEGGDAEHRRQSLAAKFLRAGKRVPAALGPAAIEILPAWRHGDVGAVQHRARLVADLAERGDLLGREAPGFGEDRIGQILGQVAEQPGVERRLQAGDVLQREGDFLNRGAIHSPFLQCPSRPWPPCHPSDLADYPRFGANGYLLFT